MSAKRTLEIDWRPGRLLYIGALIVLAVLDSPWWLLGLLVDIEAPE